MITTEQIKELRDSTGVSVMHCKKALEEAEGNMEKALMILKKKSSEVAAKKADREAADGLIVVKSAAGKAALVELNCETDFVARNDDFIQLANKISDLVLAEGADAAREKATDMINEVVQKIGENIKLGTVTIIEGETLGSYVHGGKSAVVVSLKGGTDVLAKDIAMHIAAMRPEFMTEAEVPADALAMATDLFKKEVEETGAGKPEDIKQKILDGKLATYFAERTLVKQPFVKSPDKTIQALLSEANATIVSYTLQSVGQR